MKKYIYTLLIASLAINLLFGVMQYKAAQEKEQRIDELCGTITIQCIQASARLDQAIENDNRRLALMAGIELVKLASLLQSGEALEMGVRNVYGPGSLMSIAELIIWGDVSNDRAPLGSPNDKTPFSAKELAEIEKISAALKECALSFYPESATENTYMYETKSKSSVDAIYYALSTLQRLTEGIFEAQ